MSAAVTIVEDDAAVRSAMRSVLSAAPGFDVVAEASSRKAAMAAISSVPFDIMLLDLDLNGESGIELIECCRRTNQAKIIVISVLGDEETVIRAIEAGADGYVLKDSAFQDLPRLISRVLNGEAPLSPAVARHLLRRFRNRSPEGDGQPSVSLSRRELQVLQELARGASNKEVAQKFDLSPHTVGDYVKSLYRKLNVSSRGQAVSKAVQEGLIRL